MTVTVLKAGLQTTVQSGPRIGQRHLGMPSGGAADPLSLALANRLLGNAWDAPALECTLLGPTLRFDQDCAFAMVGAEMNAALSGKTVSCHETLYAQAGDELAVGSGRYGARLYIAIGKGLQVNAVLGSASTCLIAQLAGHEGRALAANDVLQFAHAWPDALKTPDEFRAPLRNSLLLRSCASLETQMLDPESRAALFARNWKIDARADRMGLKLSGATLSVRSDGRMPSAAVFPGTVQCPEDGTPYLLNVDAGTVGGYPRVAQVARLDRHLLGQLRPGARIRLSIRDGDEAIGELHEKQAYWQRWLPDFTF